MNITEVLMREHRYILRVLDYLDSQGRQQPSAETAQRLLEALRFVRDYADAIHHGKEEDCLFPVLQAAGMPRQGPVNVMLHEHKEGRAYIRQARESLEQWLASERGWEAAQENIQSYTKMLRSHIGKEDSVLFALAERMLSREQKETLQAQYQKADAAVTAAAIAQWEAWVEAVQPAAVPTAGAQGPGCLQFIAADDDLLEIFQRTQA